ncbi:MAG: HAMP domain-containing protein [Elusimicrobia bacterium]|nr:HAMP domain-containing protein [Elusimicrobiota bacterium]
MTGATVLVVAMGLMAMGHIHHGLAVLLRGELTSRGAAVAEMVSEAGSRLTLEGDEFGLHRLLQETVHKNQDVSYAYVLDASGAPRAHSFPGGFPRGLADMHDRSLARGMRLIDTPEEGRIQDVFVPFTHFGLGTVHIGMREGRVRGRIAALVIAWGTGALLLFAAGLGAAYWLTGQFTERIARLIAATHRVGAGDLSATAADGSRDEIGRLAEAFDRMTADLRLSQEELLRAGKLAAVGELASGVAHEINNPLNIIGVCCRSLLERARGPAALSKADLAEFPEYLSAIEEEIRRCKKITSSLLDFARKRDPVLGEVDLNALVLETLPLAELRRGGAAFEPRLAKAPARVTGDGDQLRQVLMNLLLNAVDQCPSGGSVRVTTARSNGSVTLSVSDEGPGIPAALRARLFEPFFSTKPPGQGTGLGLAICRRIVDSHGGSIAAENLPGRGAVFTVTLPAAGGRDA